MFTSGPGDDRISVLRVADVPRSTPGGMNRFILKSGLALEARGHQVDYLLREGIARRAHGRIRRLVVPWAIPALVRKRARMGRRYDLVEIHEPLASAYCLERRLGVGELPPIAALSFGTEERLWTAQKDRWRRLEVPMPLKSRFSVPLTLLSQSRYALRNSDQVMAPNNADRDYLEGRLGIDRRRVSRVNTGVGEPFFSIERRPERRARRIVFVGTWTDRKGIRELCEGWQRVARREELSLALVGVGVAASTVLAAFPEELRDRVSVRTQVGERDLLKELARADAFVLASWLEGMPLATLEAAAAGLPCIVSAIPGHLELFRPPDPEADGAVLIPPHDVGALAAALERLARDPELSQRLGANARERARVFTWAETAKRLEAAYFKAIEQPMTRRLSLSPGRRRPPV
jgi:glycosyltransferase involved in cell wall biosynthesis